ncbi:hypothetical protein HHI36_007619 [Cryptolaemus montrouzieri]|uniref:Uncharacterized protein n=1 Tax=Cryptolaemus montrouzieri TaxID=559131 RepID=A0ABD2MQM1_9CUCU
MRNKGHKVTSREETLRNFTREFLIEEKRRCEVDRYISDFRVLIHKKPHENHNYLNRLLQDYTSIFLSHERISENKSNEDEKKYQLKKQLASKMKNSPKKRYVKSKLSKTDERQSYSVLKAETADFLRKLRAYEELEQIAYEIFFKLSQNNRISRNINATGGKMYKTSAVPEEIPYKKHYRNVYIVNDPTKSSEIKLNKPISQNGETKKILSNKQSEKNPLENFEYIKNETIEFMKNNRDHNDAERKILFEQYQTNKYIQKYVDSLTSSEKQKAEPSSPKKGIFNKIKNMIGLSPDNTTKFYKNVENNNQIGNTKIFLETERKYSNAEFEAYKLFYIKHGELPNPLLENIKEIAYNDNVFVNNESANSGDPRKNQN